MPMYDVPISLNAIVSIEAKNREELAEKIRHEVEKAISEGKLHYEEWQLYILEDEVQ